MLPGPWGRRDGDTSPAGIARCTPFDGRMYPSDDGARLDVPFADGWGVIHALQLVAPMAARAGTGGAGAVTPAAPGGGAGVGDAAASAIAGAGATAGAGRLAGAAPRPWGRRTISTIAAAPDHIAARPTKAPL
jgi:hypothetical protein